MVPRVLACPKASADNFAVGLRPRAASKICDAHPDCPRRPCPVQTSPAHGCGPHQGNTRASHVLRTMHSRAHLRRQCSETPSLTPDSHEEAQEPEAGMKRRDTSSPCSALSCGSQGRLPGSCGQQCQRPTTIPLPSLQTCCWPRSELSKCMQGKAAPSTLSTVAVVPDGAVELVNSLRGSQFSALIVRYVVGL